MSDRSKNNSFIKSRSMALVRSLYLFLDIYIYMYMYILSVIELKKKCIIYCYRLVGQYEVRSIIVKLGSVV